MDTIVINTEAHIFPRFKLVRGLKTGWDRKPRDKDGKIVEEKGKAKEKDKWKEEDSSKEKEKEKKGAEASSKGAEPTTEAEEGREKGKVVS